jgi:hypothetical protein
MHENVIKVFEYEFYFPQNTEEEEKHVVLLTNYRVIVAKERYSDFTGFSLASNYND